MEVDDGGILLEGFGLGMVREGSAREDGVRGVDVVVWVREDVPSADVVAIGGGEV